MKIKELINQLQKFDPNDDVTIDNVDIFSIDEEPSYYDGCKQTLIRDDKKEDCYNIIGASITSQGTKVVISGHSISEALWSNPELPIFYDTYSKEHYCKQFELLRTKIRKMKNRIAEKKKSQK